MKVQMITVETPFISVITILWKLLSPLILRLAEKIT